MNGTRRDTTICRLSALEVARPVTEGSTTTCSSRLDVAAAVRDGSARGGNSRRQRILASSAVRQNIFTSSARSK